MKHNPRGVPKRNQCLTVFIFLSQLCQNIIRSNVAVGGSRSASGFSEKGTPLTFLTEDEQVMKETGRLYE